MTFDLDLTFSLEWLRKFYDSLSFRSKSSRLRDLYDSRKLVIAGGAVRDCLLGREPKDIDVFIMQDLDLGHMHFELRDSPLDIEWSTDDYGCGRLYGKGVSEEGIEVQFICRPGFSVDGLLHDFDWNICRFALTNAGLMRLEDIENVAPGKPLLLRPNGLRTASSSLRRGLMFAKRYDMILRPEDESALRDVIEMPEFEDTISRAQKTLSLLPAIS